MTHTNYPTEYTLEDLQPVTEWVEVPYFRNGVRAGLPNDNGDYDYEQISVPKAMAFDACLCIRVKGDSMRDFHLLEDDEIMVRTGAVPDSGDIVVARVDGGFTVKTFYEGADSHRWLLPGNENYSPLPIDGTCEVEIVGVVESIRHLKPHIALTECAQIMRRSEHVQEYSPLLTRRAIVEMRSQQVNDALKRAAQSTVSAFISELHQQELMGYVSFREMPVRQLVQLVNAHYGTAFGYENFRRHLKAV